MKYWKVSTFLNLSQQVSSDLFIFCLLGFDRIPRLDFGFLSIFTAKLATASHLVMLSLDVLLTFFQTLDRWSLLLQCHIAKLAVKNSQISLLILRILTSLGYFLIISFIADFYQLGLTDVYNNGKTVKQYLGENFVHPSE